MSETGKTFEKVRNTLQPLVAKSWTEGVALANSVPENVAKSLTETVANSVPGNIAKSMAESVAKCVTESVAKSFPDSNTVRKPKELLENKHSDSYKYEPLPGSTCIRILRVEAATASEPIHCTMRTVDLNDKPAFLALSYSWKQDKSLASLHALGHEHILRNSTWKATQNWRAMMGQRDYASSGEREAKSMEIFHELFSEKIVKESWIPHTIFCDGAAMTIQDNLYNALLHLRKSRPGDYWIDAVCINQKDVNEKSAQVQIMGRIYQSATGVVVWLGDVPALLDEGVQKLSQKLATYSRSSPPKFSDEDLSGIDGWIIQLAMVWLLTRRWFRRLWVVQESCLALKLDFVLGDYDFSPVEISCIIRCLEESSSETSSAWLVAPVLPWTPQFKRIPAMLASTDFFQSGGRWTLRDWLDATTARKTEKPQDVVFAGLALLDVQSLVIDQDLQLPEEQSVLHSPHPRLWQVLHADCDAEVSFVLLNLAACILSHWDFNLLFAYTLRYRPPPNSTISKTPLHSMASWIPDPRRCSSRELQPGYMLSDSRRPVSVSKDSGCARPRISADGTTLFMTAARWDEITQHYSPPGFADNPEREMIDGVNWISRLVPRVYVPTGKPGLQTFVNVAMSKYRMKREPVAEAFELFLCSRFCEFLDSWLQGKRSLGSPFAFLHSAKVPEWLPFFGALFEKASMAYAEIRKSHPGLKMTISSRQQRIAIPIASNNPGSPSS